MKYFARQQMAADIANALAGKSFTSDAPNGLFLAAPRRTGKSTFLQRDLKPELETQGAVVVYVDLWSDKSRDPGDLISSAIGNTLKEHLGLVSKFVNKSGLANINIGGVLKIDTDKIGEIDGMTLAEALAALKSTSGKPVALIIDEAQQALTSDAGESAMTALKSARDQMNSTGINLMIVMSGSDRDKLMRLVNSNKAPFYGSNITSFRPLDQGFVDFVAAQVEADNESLKPVDRATLMNAFKAFGYRPQFFNNAIGAALNPMSRAPGVSFEGSVLNAATEHVLAEESQMESDFLGLSPIEQVVMWRLLEQESKFRAYDAAALEFYQDKLGAKVTPAQAQNALDTLRSRSPSLVWKSLRSEYATEDASMHTWFEKRVNAGTWPPGGAIKPAKSPTRRRKPQ